MRRPGLPHWGGKGVWLVSLLAAVALAPACFPVSIEDGQYRCDVNGLCPAGFECVEGLCRLPGSGGALDMGAGDAPQDRRAADGADADQPGPDLAPPDVSADPGPGPDGAPTDGGVADGTAVPDGSVTDGGGPDGNAVALCPPDTVVLRDSFDGIDPLAWDTELGQPGASIVQEGGRLVISVEPSADAVGDFSVSYTLRQALDLLKGMSTVEVFRLGAGEVDTYLAWTGFDGIFAVLGFDASSGTVFALANGALVAERQFLAEKDRFWRLRTAGDQVLFETSGDGREFQRLAAVGAPDSFIEGLVELGVFVNSPLAEPTSSSFEQFLHCGQLAGQ